MTHTPGVRPLPVLLATLLVALLGLAVAPVIPADAATRTIKVLVVPVYWSKPLDTTASAKKLVGTDAAKWVSTVSGYRAKLATTVMRPTKIAAGCTYHTDRALAAARGRGYRLSSYDVVLVLTPGCAVEEFVGIEGHARVVELAGKGTRTVPRVVHQLGHALADLPDGAMLYCEKKRARVTIGTNSECQRSPVDNDISVMGGGRGGFSAPELARLGWLPSSQITTRTSGTKTISLAPLTATTKMRAVKIVASTDVTYWLEFRTRTGVDASLYKGATGVVIHRDSRSLARKYLSRTTYPMLIDTQLSRGGVYALRTGSTWTSPEGVRIALGAISAQAAKVTVAFKAPKPSVPAAPQVGALGEDDQIKVTWSAPADHGRPIDRYELELWKGGRKTDVGQLAYGDTHSAIVPADNDSTWTVRIRARNDLGAGPWSSVKATPRQHRPSISFVSPAKDAVLAGTSVTFRVRATPHPQSRQPITAVTIWGNDARRQSDGTWAVTVDLRKLTTDGARRVDAVATDAAGRHGSASLAVEIPRRFSAPSFVTPTGDPVLLTGSTLTVTVRPGADRLGYLRTDSVRITFDLVTAYATEANGWTVSFPRSAATRNVPDDRHFLEAVTDGPSSLESLYLSVSLTLV